MKYPKIVGWSVVITMWTSCGVGLNCMKSQEQGNSEIVNTAEDMIEWIGHDLESGKIDSTIADTYIVNLEGIITDSRK
tara:strand:- start:155 stop:388 length:234 start_codon:yes stop_codon:yes gene_type:complete